ncbi:MAG: NAD(+) diphosphatase [Sphingobium sp.]|nr:NAD(+) diphosphatase [Sphingobium sp.]
MPLKLPGFVGGTLDRADPVRSDPALLAEAFAAPGARLLLLEGLEPVERDGLLALEGLAADAVLAEHALLGIDSDGPVFVRLDPRARNGQSPSPVVWALAGTLPPDQLALYGTARSLVDWHARHGYCAACGAGTALAKAGWSRRCPDCRSEHFPRVDPVTIMLAEHDGRILLGRQPRFPAGRYSALAGFVEPGETVEEAVARELWEEAGIRVHSVRYVMSQPWPFPSSLMIACMAKADDPELTIDRTEIEDAFWCDADGVRAALAGDPQAPFIAPPPLAVARHLLAYWLERADA